MAASLDRRTFLKTAAAAAAAGALTSSSAAVQAGRSEPLAAPGNGGPVVVSSGNGLPAAAKAMEMIEAGADPLEAVVAGVNIVERNPKDHSVGYGGLPNEDGVVELDSCVMHGPTHNAGAVAALRNIKTPSSVAKLVMERTDHVLLVGEGALRFARAHGFEEVNMLTEDARRAWLKWKEGRPDDDWLPPPGSDPEDGNKQARGLSGLDKLHTDPREIEFSYGTINCVALDKRSNLAGVTTTSGLSYKIPGRVGDSPIIGAGLYVDNEVGAAGATGRGEAVILNCGSYAIVEKMRVGRTPTEACLEVLSRIADHVKDPRLRKPDGRPDFSVTFYAVRKDGLFGSASMWSGAHFTVHAGGRNRKEECAFLYERRK